MSLILRCYLPAICALGLAVPAAAQLDSSALRAKYGSPLNREIFRLPQGFDLTVDYGTGHQVCKLDVPALMPTDEPVSRESERNQRMYAFLLDLVPASMRGEELGRQLIALGAISTSLITYTHVSISEVFTAQRDHDTITVMFKGYDCERSAGR